MDANAVVELEALIAAESSRLVFLDLADVTLVHEEAIQLLAGVQAAGAVLMNCPEYVRSWIEARARRRLGTIPEWGQLSRTIGFGS
jgi:hypothetical protein